MSKSCVKQRTTVTDSKSEIHTMSFIMSFLFLSFNQRIVLGPVSENGFIDNPELVNPEMRQTLVLQTIIQHPAGGQDGRAITSPVSKKDNMGFILRSSFFLESTNVVQLIFCC